MTREEAIKELEHISEDTIQRDCSTCGRPTAGIYNGVCCYCSLCEVVLEIFKDYHHRKHFRSQWRWNRKWKNEALNMAIAALREQETVAKCNGLNEPLTLDELRQMDGEPVYIPKGKCWVLVSTANFFPVFVWPDKSSCSAADWYSMCCGQAYRQKPEEVQK